MEAKRLRELFDKWVDQTISDKEEMELLKYLSRASSEPDRLDLSAALYEQTNTAAPLDPENAERIIASILHPEQAAETLAPANLPASAKPRRIIPPVWRYAAIFAGALALGAAAWLYLKKGEPARQPQPVIAGKYFTTPVDHNRATLVLEDGRNIDLAKNPDPRIHQAEAEIIRTDSAALQYAASALETARPAGFNTLYIPRGAKYKVRLSDGSEIWLNAESKLRYPTHFGDAPKREVFLESGEAYFNVRHDPKQPFIVNTNGMEVEVLGTEFNVNTYKKNTATTLVQGSVRLKDSKTSTLLRPGQQGTLSESGFTTAAVETDLYTAWVHNQILCVETPLEEVMDDLGRQYDFAIEFTSPQLRERKFGGRLNITDHIEDVLAILEQTAYVKFSIRGRTILVSAEMPK